jgi:hypothetical protein
VHAASSPLLGSDRAITAHVDPESAGMGLALRKHGDIGVITVQEVAGEDGRLDAPEQWL